MRQAGPETELHLLCFATGFPGAFPLAMVVFLVLLPWTPAPSDEKRLGELRGRPVLATGHYYHASRMRHTQWRRSRLPAHKRILYTTIPDRWRHSPLRILAPSAVSDASSYTHPVPCAHSRSPQALAAAASPSQPAFPPSPAACRTPPASRRTSRGVPCMGPAGPPPNLPSTSCQEAAAWA